MMNTNNSMEPTKISQGAHHIGLTVANIKQTGDFFITTLGFKKVGEKPDYPAIFISDGTIMLTLWQVIDPGNANAFDRKNNIGLHHLALRVENTVVLEKLHERLLKTDDVVIEFSPEQLGDKPIQHMMCIIPGGIRVEFIAA